MTESNDFYFENFRLDVQNARLWRERKRMLRERVEALDVLTTKQPLILWREDRHWSDPSTLELLALLARRREPARLLVLGTYRPGDVLGRDYPLRTVK